jgi:hypothetical protein
MTGREMTKKICDREEKEKERKKRKKKRNPMILK